MMHSLKLLFSLLTFVVVTNSQAQESYTTRQVAGIHSFKVTWMTYIETKIRLKRNGKYTISETMDNIHNEGHGLWEVSHDSLFLNPIEPLEGPLSQRDTLPIWTDSLGVVKIGAFDRIK